MRGVLVALLCLVPFVLCVTGIDFSAQIGEGLNSGDFTCLKSNGMDFAVIQTWQGGYQWNSAIAANVEDAWKAGLAHVDVYIFMCPNCEANSNGADVVKTVVDGLSSKGVKYGMIWFDVEQCTGCWYDASQNANYLASGINQAVSMGAKIGVYSSMYEWSSTVGSYTGFSKYPQWYAHYDGVASFADGMYKYGGWSSPSIKQYNDHGPCFSVDVNWYPDSFMEMRAGLLNGTIKQELIDLDELNAYYTRVQLNN